ASPCTASRAPPCSYLSCDLLAPPSAGVFFFSSRRRHTRFSRDWSSDVCSSDLRDIEMPVLHVLQRMERYGVLLDTGLLARLSREFGRASCRERVEIWGGAGAA